MNNEKYAHNLVWNERKECYGICKLWQKHPKTKQILWAKNYRKKAWFIPIDELKNEES